MSAALPDQVKEGARYEDRRREIAAFNRAHPWLKRGISITHCRCLPTICLQKLVSPTLPSITCHSIAACPAPTHLVEAAPMIDFATLSREVNFGSW